MGKLSTQPERNKFKTDRTASRGAQKLAKEIVRYDQNIKQAILTETVNPGTYHLSFFEHIRQIIALLKKNVSEASNWLAVFNKRSKSKGTFWNKAKTGGSAYMFSSEHVISRSIG
jgi:hypothetical protein